MYQGCLHPPNATAEGDDQLPSNFKRRRLGDYNGNLGEMKYGQGQASFTDWLPEALSTNHYHNETQAVCLDLYQVPICEQGFKCESELAMGQDIGYTKVNTYIQDPKVCEHESNQIERCSGFSLDLPAHGDESPVHQAEFIPPDEALGNDSNGSQPATVKLCFGMVSTSSCDIDCF